MGAIEAVLARVDWLAERGSRVMQAAAWFAWLGAAAATLAVFALLGVVGWLIGLVLLLPGWLLWRYARKLATAFDVERIRGQLADAAGTVGDRVGDVIEGVAAIREQPLRGGLGVLRAVRAVRSDLAGFGIDVAGIAEIANPGVLAAAAFSLAAGLGLWVVAVVGALVRAVV
jgi:hypothetical protein